MGNIKMLFVCQSLYYIFYFSDLTGYQSLTV